MDDERGTARGPGRRLAIAVFVTVLVAYGYFYQAGGWNQNSRFDLVRAIVEDGTLKIDRFEKNTGDESKRDGHYYSDKAPGLSLLAVPVWGAAQLVISQPPSARALAWGAWTSTVVTVGVPSALAVVALLALARRLGASTGAATALALAYGLGTLAWPYATLLYGHQLIGALMLIAFAVLATGPPSGATLSARRLAGAGALLGVAVVVEYTAALAAVVLAAYALTRAPWRRVVVAMAAGAVGPGLVLAAYHAAAFGGPLTLPYEFSTQPHRHMGVFMGLGAPDPRALWGILGSSYRGLFFAAPWLLLAIPGGVLLWRAGRRAETVAAAAIFVLFVWLNASLVDWQGGWAMGPRYLVPAIPFLVVLVVGLVARGAATPRAPRLRRAGWVVAGLAVVGSAYLMLVGTAVKPEVPTHVRAPFGDYLLPRWSRGEVAVSTQSIDTAGYP
ncbi:MAG: hypothetical protein R2939_21360, partial [Kofleriaceae bacterium]